MSFEGRVALITGAARGIGAAIARALATEGAHVVLTGRSLSEPSHAALDGTLLEVATSIKRAGGTAFVHKMDVTDAEQIRDVVRLVAQSHGGIDILVNNASAIDARLFPSQARTDWMYATNARATHACTVACLPHLEQQGGQVLTMAPPLEGARRWLTVAPAYAMSKYGMTMSTLSVADRVKANTLWPKRTVATAATKMLQARTDQPCYSAGRSPKYVAAAALLLLGRDTTGHTFLDEDILPHCDAPGSPVAPLDMFV